MTAVLVLVLALPLPPSGRWRQLAGRWTRLIPRGGLPQEQEGEAE